ncbi:MAG: HAD family hydrolase [Bacillota bacterium]
MLDRSTYLFDLDGTLLPMEIEEFMEIYFKALTSEFRDLGQPREVVDKLMAATGDMINNDGQQTNKQVFIDSFFERVDVDNTGEIMERFDRFYREHFPRLESKFQFDNRAEGVIEMLKDHGYRLVIATNPLFPRQAITARVKWANLNPGDFEFITAYDNMHYSKPNPDYYRELMEKLDQTPGDCVMVGNDRQEDMIAGNLGIYTCMITDYSIDRGRKNIKPDWSGTMEELEQYLEQHLVVADNTG